MLNGSLTKFETWKATVAIDANTNNNEFYNAYGVYAASLNIANFSGYSAQKWASRKFTVVTGKNTNRDGKLLAYGIVSGNAITINVPSYGHWEVSVMFIY